MPAEATDTIKLSPIGENGAILLVTLDRPPVNAIDTSTYRRLAAVFQEAADNPELRCIVLTAAGNRAFCAGSDIRELTRITPRSATQRARTIRAAFDAIWRCPVPVIGAINGPALGAGLAICSYCDVLVAAESATFALPEIKVGVLGGTKQLSRLVPPKKLRWMALTGEAVSAAELKAFGSVEAVVPREDLESTAIAHAIKIAGKSAVAIRLQKEALNLTEYMDLGSGYHVEQLYTGLLSGSSDAKEAGTAYLDKRDAKFKD